MKKIAILFVVCALLGACENMAQYAKADKDASDMTKVRACMLTEAQSKYEAGTLFANELKTTAKTIANTCLTKLALQKAGITSETQAAAEEIISGFKTIAGK